MKFSPEVLAAMASAPWPGNIRQLQNEVKRLVICAAEDVISPSDLRDEMRVQAESTNGAADERSTMDRAMDTH